MDSNDKNLNSFADSDGFSVESILADFEAERAVFSEPEKIQMPEPDPENHIVYDSSEQAIGGAQFSSEEDFYSSEFLENDITEQKSPEGKDWDEPVMKSAYPKYSEDSYESDFSDDFFDEPPRDSDELPAEDEKTEPREKERFSEERLWRESSAIDESIAETEIGDTEDVYAAAKDYIHAPRYKSPDSPEPDFKERVITPLIGLIAESARRRSEKREAERKRLESENELPPELKADRAAAFYAAQAQSVKTRATLASAVTVILLYLSFGLPAAGLLGNSPTIKAIVCIVLELVVLIIGLDIFSTGILTLFRGRAGAESLIAVACIVSIADAAAMAVTGNMNSGLPFCGATALSVTLALWGNHFSFKGFSISFETASKTEAPTVVLSLSGTWEDSCVLAKAQRPVTGFVRTAEATDIFESAYRFVAPVLIAGCFILGLFCYFASERCDNLLHTLAAATAACASLSAVFGFAYPFYVLSKRLAKSGVAIAGSSGAADLGRIRRVLITDTDIFPVRTLSISDVSISESARSSTVISYTGSMIAAAGLGIAPVFTELMQKNGCSMQKVEEFACHEGGGLVARINGDLVYVGTSAFMQLMGVRVPRDTSKTNAVYTAINDSLTGIISVSYKPVASVQRALVTLLKGRNDPLFVIRDFNITPLLVKQKFRLPLDSYDFPSFADRYRISSSVSEDSGTVVAMSSKGGINSVAGLTNRGRALYNRLRVSLALSIIGSVMGLVLMLSLCWTGSYDSASVGNLIAYMLLWLVPTIVVSQGLKS